MSEEEAAPNTWLSTSQAAARLGISERTVRRRCEAGKLAGRLETTASGREWRVDPAALGEGAATTTAIGADTADISGQGADSIGQGAVIPQVLVAAPEAPSSSGDARLIEVLERENAFLRGVIEQQQRDAAELRAALREALKISARALPEAGAPASALGPGQVREVEVPQVLAAATPQVTPVAQDATQNAAQSKGGQVGASAPSEPQQVAREPRNPLRRWLLRMLRG